MARLQAEEVVLADLVWLTPPEDEETMESENPSWFYLFDKAIWEAQNEDQDIY